MKSERTQIRSQKQVQATPGSHGPQQRRGVVLLVVLIVVVMLTLGVYAYTEVSVSEADAVRMYERQFQSRVLAESGLELALLALDSQVNLEDDDYYNFPEMFSDQLLIENDEPANQGHCVLIAGRDDDPSGQSYRFGLTSESGKLNLNSLVGWKLAEPDAQKVLINIPGMTPELADAILDWIDEDESPRNLGAESEFYLSMPEAYPAGNRPLKSLDELLYVRGVTPDLLYGEDRNRNGLLDPGEDDGDGQFQRGWVAYFTVHSRESNKQNDGTDRIFLNEPVLATMYDALEDQFGEATARFIAAYRMNGAYDPTTQNQEGQQGQQGRRGRRGRNGGNGQSSQQSSDSGTQDEDSAESSEQSGTQTGQTPQEQQAQQAAQELNKQPENAARAGMDLTAGGKVTIKSLYELIDIQAQAKIDEKDQVLDSPWKLGSSDLETGFIDLVNSVTISQEEFLVGRINVNHARPEVFMNLPGMEADIAELIAGFSTAVTGQPLQGDDQVMHKSLIWLLIQGQATAEQLKQLDTYLTGRGDVFHAQAVGFYGEGGPVSRMEVILDATTSPATVLEANDLTPLGGGFIPDQLLAQ